VSRGLAATDAPANEPGLLPVSSDIHLEAQRLHVWVRPELGAGICAFAAEVNGARLNLMRPAPARTTSFNDLSCYLLAPWSNRVRGAAFPWAGSQVSLRPDWPDGTAIHGTFKSLPWEMTDRSPFSVRLECDSAKHAGVNWPWRTLASVRYELDPAGLSVCLAVTNTDATPFPAGLGFHPFWLRRLHADKPPARVTVGVRGRYPCETMLPSGPAVEEGATLSLRQGVSTDDLDLDDVFTSPGGMAAIEWPGEGVRIEYECGPSLSHTVMYAPNPASPNRDIFCLEPVTMVNDGFNLFAAGWPETGVQRLTPGDTLEARWRVRITLP
jgi:aldose 1-epimerase